MSHSTIQESDVTSLKVRLIYLSENKKKQFENPVVQKKWSIIDLLIDFCTIDRHPSEIERDEIIENVSAQYQESHPSFEHIRRLCYGEPYHKPSVWSFIWGLYQALLEMISSPKEMQHILVPTKLY
jgi:hypothetical protein